MMTPEEAAQVIATLRSGREFRLANSMAGAWSFRHDAAADRFVYHSTFWGDDQQNPTVDNETLTVEALMDKLMTTYFFAPHFAGFVGSTD